MTIPDESKDNPISLINWAKSSRVEFVDIRFTDVLGMTHHFTSPLHIIDEETFSYGIGFDGSSIRGWKAIDESDMIVRPDLTTAFVDPFFDHKTMVLLSDIYDPITNQPYNRDPRTILKRAIAYMKSLGIADTAYLGPEAEFFIFSDVRFDARMESAFYSVDALNARWNMGKDGAPNLGHKMREKGGYFPTPPNDLFQDIRSETLHLLESVGVKTEKHHHEVASAGQGEINLAIADLLSAADNLVKYKYVLKNVAHKHGLSVTFMPKPLFADNGNGMHTHQSLWKENKNLFAGDGYGGLSDLAMNYIGGLLGHGPAVLAFSNPTTNSYKRLVPGFEAPVNLVYSARNRSAAIRIPTVVSSEKGRRIEFRTPDPSCCGYLAFAAMIMAGLAGVQKKTDPGQPADYNLYSITPEQRAGLKAVPANLTKVLDALEVDNSFLKAGDVFDDDFINSYVEYKRMEVEQVVNQRPHPYEFVLYYDC